MASSLFSKCLKLSVHKKKKKERQKQKEDFVGNGEFGVLVRPVTTGHTHCSVAQRIGAWEPLFCVQFLREAHLYRPVSLQHTMFLASHRAPLLLPVFKSHHTTSTNADGHEYQCPDQRVRVLTRSREIHSVCTLKAHLKDL